MYDASRHEFITRKPVDQKIKKKSTAFGIDAELSWIFYRIFVPAIFVSKFLQVLLILNDIKQ